MHVFTVCLQQSLQCCVSVYVFVLRRRCGLLHYPAPIMQKLPGQPFGSCLPFICNSDGGAVTAWGLGTAAKSIG